MPARDQVIETVLEQLRNTPSHIADSVAGAPAARFKARPSRDEWSASEVLAHLRACADVWGRCIDAILTEDAPTIRAVSPRTWIKDTDYQDQDFKSSLAGFARQRTRLLSVLGSLPPSSWSRTATIVGAGKPLTRTVLDYAQRMARHERPHVKQITRAIHGQ